MNKTISKISLSLGILSVTFALLLSPLSANAEVQRENSFDSIIVKPKEEFKATKRFSKLMYKSGVLRYKKVKENLYVIPISETENPNEKIEELKQSGRFSLVEPDYKLTIDQNTPERNYIKITKVQIEDTLPVSDPNNLQEVTPNDKDFNSQYYLRETNVTKAWNATVGDPSLLIGVLDTGIDASHPDLKGKIIGGFNTNGNDLKDEVGHGTEVAGIIAANTNNDQGIAGITWNTKVLSLRITDEFGQARVSTVVHALEEAYNKGVKIVHVSLSTNQFSQTLKDAIKETQDRGILVVSTSGNTGIQELRYPAAFDGVIGVGAVDENKQLESYSTIGEHVKLVAPGSFIYTTSTGSSYDHVTGTSFAAPQVTGAVALLLSITPNLTSNEVKEILFNSTEDLGNTGKDLSYGYGLLNTEKAVQLAKVKKH